MNQLSEITLMSGKYREGLTKGPSEGRVEGIKEAARHMKAQGISTSVIAAVTGLSEEIINNLPNE